MFCFFNVIYVCGINELNNLNLNNFSSIINCSPQLNNSLTGQNIITPIYKKMGHLFKNYLFLRISN